MQINVRESTEDLESYYYYAQISKEIYTNISQNELNNGFILLSNTKYWGKDDLITDYKNTEHNGELVFRIENIARISPINKEPITGQGIEQFYEKAKDSSKDKAKDSSDEKVQDSSEDKVQEKSQDSPEESKTPTLPKIDAFAPLDNA